jgi:hypothetical protein
MVPIHVQRFDVSGDIKNNLKGEEMWIMEGAVMIRFKSLATNSTDNPQSV